MYISKFLTKTLLLFTVPATSAITLAQSPQTSTESGPISGVRANGSDVYRGIPFAAPLVDDLRWREPARVAPWTGTRKADAFAPARMQIGVSIPGETPPAVSEDCLYLNIRTPAKRAGERLPVIVWIYGGGYINGSASMPLYWGDRLAHKGVIVVTIAYRLGPLGFLALPELTREPPHHSSGNYGLMDQIAALEWIQRNITAFGGDPKNITIAGQSSGSISVSILMASPLAKGLFQGAIGESGGLFEPLQLAPKFLLANALVAAYPHATDEQAKEARLGLERDLRFGWDMWAWARLQAATGQNHVYYFVSATATLPRRLNLRRLGCEPLRRALVCLRPSEPGSVELDQGRPESGRGDVQLLG
jgi:para-nitrobenzyl esterase